MRYGNAKIFRLYRRDGDGEQVDIKRVSKIPMAINRTSCSVSCKKIKRTPFIY